MHTQIIYHHRIYPEQMILDLLHLYETKTSFNIDELNMLWWIGDKSTYSLGHLMFRVVARRLSHG